MAPEFQPDDDKLKELILLISARSEGDSTFGAVKLNKLLFYCDFSAYLTFGAPITGQEYFALPQGPAPRRMKPVSDDMVEAGDLAYQRLEYHGYQQKKPIALREPNYSAFTGSDSV